MADTVTFIKTQSGQLPGTAEEKEEGGDNQSTENCHSKIKEEAKTVKSPVCSVQRAILCGQSLREKIEVGSFE